MKANNIVRKKYMALNNMNPGKSSKCPAFFIRFSAGLSGRIRSIDNAVMKNPARVAEIVAISLIFAKRPFAIDK